MVRYKGLFTVAATAALAKAAPPNWMNEKILNHEMRDLAQRLVAYEAAAGDSSDENTPAVFRVSEKLRGPLSTLAGATGFRMLLARALTLAKAHAPRISTVQVKLDGTLDGLSELHNEDEAAEAGILLIAKLLGLLVVFIGEDLVLRLVLDVWPDLPALDPELHRKSET